MDPDDIVFWERLAEMPPIEAEQECVMRREGVALQLSMLMEQKKQAELDQKKREVARIGGAVSRLHAQLTLLNERIKYLRRMMDSAKWATCVIELFGHEAYEQCVVWRVQRESEWAAANPVKENFRC